MCPTLVNKTSHKFSGKLGQKVDRTKCGHNYKISLSILSVFQSKEGGPYLPVANPSNYTHRKWDDTTYTCTHIGRDLTWVLPGDCLPAGWEWGGLRQNNKDISILKFQQQLIRFAEQRKEIIHTQHSSYITCCLNWKLPSICYLLYRMRILIYKWMGHWASVGLQWTHWYVDE